MTLALREYQHNAVESVFNYICSRTGTDQFGQPYSANPLLGLPCRSGKSLIIAGIIKRAFEIYSKTRIVMVTDVKELVVNSYNDLLAYWPNSPVGILSAGLKSKDIHYPIIYGTLQTVVNYDLGYRDFLIIDESQMVSDKEQSQYQQIIAQLKKRNPFLRVIGMSATNYRQGSGCLTNGSVFSDIVFNMCNIEGYAYLLAQGYIVPVISKRTINFIDTTGIGRGQDGDFNKRQLEELSDNNDLNYKMMQESCYYGRDRRSWIVYANGIKHAEDLNQMLNEKFGVSSTVVHSKMPSHLRDQRIAAYDAGEYRCLVNKDILTKGYNNKNIDLLIMTRATMSVPLWVQIGSRGMTPALGKTNCLLLDFGRNVERLGRIDNPLIPKGRGKGPPEEPPVKECEACGVYNFLSARFCEACGAEFKFREKLIGTAGKIEPMGSDLPQIETFSVTHVTYSKHVKNDIRRANPEKSLEELPFSIKVSYYCGEQVFTEWVTVESDKTFVKHKGHEWFRQRLHGLPPETNEQLLAQCSYARTPKSVRVWTNKVKYPEIVGVEW